MNETVLILRLKSILNKCALHKNMCTSKIKARNIKQKKHYTKKKTLKELSYY